MTILNLLYSSLEISAPILVILLCGIIFKRLNILNDGFIQTGNKLVFTIALPSLLFLNVASRSFTESLDVKLVLYGIVATVVSVVLLSWFSKCFITEDQRKVFVHCSFRGNMGIIGLALCVNAFGNDIIASAAIYLAILTIIYNVIAVVLLSNNKRSIFSGLIKNPLIIAIIAAMLWSTTNVAMPSIINKSLGYLAQLTLPLALLCIGAGLEWQSLRLNHKTALLASTFKLIVVPMLAVFGGVLIGLDNQELGILFLMMATPTAAAAYIMSHQMSKHGQLAGEIITISTLLSPITVTIGLMVMKSLGYI